jgi:murein DD-endopeptidase MepM/ murein hydrolase activator NlpD
MHVKTINQQLKERSTRAKWRMGLASIGLLAVACLVTNATVSPAAIVRGSVSTAKASASGFALPFTNGRISSGFNQGRWHPAIDLAAPTGTAVAATTSGQKVSFAGRRGGYGNVVITRDRQGRTHLYAHLNSIATRTGQVLKQGQKLGTVGSTGFSTGPHLHYELKSAAGRHLNPGPLLFPRRVTSIHAQE